MDCNEFSCIKKMLNLKWPALHLRYTVQYASAYLCVCVNKELSLMKINHEIVVLYYLCIS